MALPTPTRFSRSLPENGANISDVKARTNSDWNGNLFRDPAQPMNPGQNAGSGMAGAGNCLPCLNVPIPANEGCIEPGSRRFDDGQLQRDAGPLHKLNTFDYPNKNYRSSDDGQS
jgi:hypothetical protein